MMQIIKPYGRSVVDTGTGEPTQRKLQDKNQQQHDISQFVHEHAELVVAQWISVIDKIARKPHANGKNAGKCGLPTAGQYQLRDILGTAAWVEVLKHLSPGMDAQRQQYLETLWYSKIHPYGKQTQEQEKAIPLQGRWYQRFVGDVLPENVDAALAKQVAERIHLHLYEAALRINPEVGARRKGSIQAQAETITNNTLRPAVPPITWSKADWSAYNRYDVAERIYLEAKYRLEQKQDARQKKQPIQPEWRIDGSLAGKLLFEHWAQVFKGSDGKSRISEAKTHAAGLFALHMAVKDFYTRLFDSNRKEETLVKFLLPQKKKALQEKLTQKLQNTDVAARIRLGKIQYYRKAQGEVAPLANSRFWGSDGQAEIKRAEAFVRVWRHVLGQANLTLANWASLASPADLWGGDSFFGHFSTHINGKLFATDIGLDSRRTVFDQNLHLLFGDAAGLFQSDDETRKASILLAHKCGGALRNAAFHFKGRAKFLQALENDLPQAAQSGLQMQLSKLWDEAQNQQGSRLLKILEGAHVFHVCTQEQVQQLVNTLGNVSAGELPLPRFGRVIERNHHARLGTNLPVRGNRQAMEQHPARKCQYVMLKLLYERAFRVWLENTTDEVFSVWLETALERTTNAARNNPNVQGKSQHERELVMARAAKLPISMRGKGGKGKEKSIRQFFYDLSAATASEMRVQRGYASDAGKAREQAEYIDELLRDVVALAFREFIRANGFDWLLDIDPQQELRETRCCLMEHIRFPAIAPRSNAWQPVLYFLLHLMPVGEVSQLLHQLAKWEILAKPEQARTDEEGMRLHALQQTLKLYLDMHDSHYTGAESMPAVERAVLDTFATFYETRNGLDKVFEDQGNGRDGARYLPQRGLREIRRFGHVPVLQALVKDKITAQDVTHCLQQETVPANGKLSPVAQAQQRRETLHGEWVKERKQFKAYRDYAAALQTVVVHRQLSNHIRLVDHVAAHRIVMKVLARLADFSGLFERDLTFVTLAALHEHQLQPEDFFVIDNPPRYNNRGELEKDGLTLFKNGQIIEALGKVQACRNALKHQIVGQVNLDVHRSVRNDFAHFNMLYGKQRTTESATNRVIRCPAAQGLNLTCWVNCARNLMSYDRKLKNAVSQSIIELMEREGFILTWEMDTNHQLCSPKLQSRQVEHLGGQRFPLVKDERKKLTIRENLHSVGMVKLLAHAFGAVAEDVKDISTLDLNTVKWVKKDATL